MAVTNGPDPLTLPEGTRLFYIGPPKTGTTSIQEAARDRREKLYELGVYYPGTARNHRAEVHALMREPDPMVGKIGGQQMRPGSTRAEADRIPPESEWRALMDDIDSEANRRILVTHEHASMASDDEAATFVRELGSSVHVVITLRSPADILVSRWLENLKEGLREPFERWLEQIYDPTDSAIPTRVRRYLDQAGLVERWAAVAGAENVTVIVVDKTKRELLPETFERLLGLPGQTLTGVVSGGLRTNRSLTLPESEIIQGVNASVVRPQEGSWSAYLIAVRRGAVTELLETRTPHAAEPRVLIPEWAAERAVRDGVQFAARIAESGVRVVGNLAQLHSDVPTLEHAGGEGTSADTMRDIAVSCLVGTVRATTGYEKALVRRIDRAQERAVKDVAQRQRAQQRFAREKVRSDKIQQRLDREKARSDRIQQRLDREKDRSDRIQQRLNGEREKLGKTRDRLARVQRRTIRDQVKGLPTEQRSLRAAESFTTHELARALQIRLSHKVRTGTSHQLG